MRHAFSCAAFLAVCSFAVQGYTQTQNITLQQETANNTSACSAPQSPPYCTAAFQGWSDTTNQGVETVLYDPPPAHVSSVPLSALMYSGWNGQFICEYQPWFGSSGHHQVGYSENTPATVTGQDNFMITEGCNINFVDFYGKFDPAQSFNLTTTDNVFKDLSIRQGYPLKMGILEDQGSFDNPNNQNSCVNQPDNGTTITCIENALEVDLTYVHNNYVDANVYWIDNGKYVVGYFGACSKFTKLNCPQDWETIWTFIKNWAANDNYNMKFIFEFNQWAGPDTSDFQAPQVTAGEYGWPQPPDYNEQDNSQYCWGSLNLNNCTQYLDTL
jgi:hypothetical protein